MLPTTDFESSSLPTPLANCDKGFSRREVIAGDPKRRLACAAQVIKLQGKWGKYEPAIQKWEQTIQRKAPAPTKPDGKENTYRLSAAFTEWMMGLPKGWITDCDLTRSEMLKACGNGVVPQQAKLALEILDVKL